LTIDIILTSTAFRRPGIRARKWAGEDTRLYGSGTVTLLFVSAIKVLASGGTIKKNAYSKPRNVNGNFGTSDLRRTTYPVKNGKIGSNDKRLISDDQL